MLGNLMKYELIRKRNTLVIFGVVLLIAEILNIYNIYKGKDGVGMFITVTLLMIFGSAIFVLYDNVKLLSDDMNESSGYMMFMTPVNGYQIVASKMIVGFIEVMVVALYLGGTLLFNYQLGNSLYDVRHMGFIQLVMDQIQVIIETGKISTGNMIYAAFVNVSDWFAFIIVVYVAIILRKTLFSRVKYGGLISFVIFVLINVAIGLLSQGVIYVYALIMDLPDMITNNMDIAADPMKFKHIFMTLIHLGLVMNLLTIGGLFAGSGYLLNKKVDL